MTNRNDFETIIIIVISVGMAVTIIVMGVTMHTKEEIANNTDACFVINDEHKREFVWDCSE